MNRRPIVVQKFGGTSVATAAARQQVVEHVARELAAGSQVAVVVSAMGRRGEPYATDTLLDLLRGAGGRVDPQHYDLMFACGEAIAAALVSHTLQRGGIAAVGMTSAQARIYTDGLHLEAEITDIETTRLHALLAAGIVPVVAGGQGVCRETLDFASLGRGGSDTSAVALGVALGADRVDIFTDVAGVATIDPRLIPSARLLRRASYESMHEMTRYGAKVVHPRAVMTGWKGRTPIAVRSTFADAPGTIIGSAPDEDRLVGIALLPPMQTLLLPLPAADAAQRAEWERRHAVLTVTDATTGRVLVGATADKALDLERVVSGVPAAAVTLSAVHQAGAPACVPGAMAPATGCCWLSVVGEASAIGPHASRCLALLMNESIEVHGHEVAGGRCTFVIPESDRDRAARLVYDVTFGAGAGKCVQL